MEYYWTTALFNHGSSSSSGSTTCNAVSITSLNGNPSSSLHLHPWQSTWELSAVAASSLYEKETNNYLVSPDPHLTCLKLGKRHCFEDDVRHVASGPTASSLNKKGKPYHDAGVQPPPPRCQVEGCGVALVDAKDYHRRHKVCETHAKAPKVLLLGIHQRFCQQCSRFHAVGEFDDSKRSCRRRLAGHNERRRKSSHDQTNSVARKPPSHPAAGKYIYSNAGECALSLLSSTTYNNPWNLSSSPDLPARCSAALRELIAENRASACRRQQLLSYCSISNQAMEDYYKLGWNSDKSGEGHATTLELMHARNSEFRRLSDNDGNNDQSSGELGDHGDGGCSDLWKLPLGY